VQAFDASALPGCLGSEIPNFDPKPMVPKDHRKRLNQMARTVQLGFVAAARAWEDGKGPRPGQIDPFRYGMEFACVMVASDLDDLSLGGQASLSGEDIDLQKWGQSGLDLVPPQWMLKYLPNMPACHASILLDAQGPNNTVTTTEVAGLQALGEAYRIMQRDLADAFLVGGCESRIHPMSFSRHNTFKVQKLSHNRENPTEAVRPFDAKRDGSVIAEAATAFGLEELHFAQQRGAPILAEVMSFASGHDRGLKGNVLANVIRIALKQANLTVGDIDHVNAAASGSPILDAFEARGISEVFGQQTPVFAPKGHFGNSGCASGLIELAASVLALKHGLLPGTLNHTHPDPECPVLVHTGAPRPTRTPYAVKLSYTDMGQCAAVVVRKWDAS
jgi:3-oxoacyl-[acyl-carrier-protein] synthase II